MFAASSRCRQFDGKLDVVGGAAIQMGGAAGCIVFVDMIWVLWCLSRLLFLRVTNPVLVLVMKLGRIFYAIEYIG